MNLWLELKVVPQAGKQGFVREKSGLIKCYLKSAPEQGKANDELVRLLSKKLGLPQENIIIAHGVTGRKKRICCKTAMSLDDACVKLGLENQRAL